MVFHLVGKWKADIWKIFFSKARTKILLMQKSVLMLTPIPRNSEVTTKIFRWLQHTLWVKTAFVGGRLFSRTHQWQLNILRTVFQSDCKHKLQLWKVFHHKKRFLALPIKPSNLWEEYLLYQFFLIFWHVWDIISFRILQGSSLR